MIIVQDLTIAPPVVELGNTGMGDLFIFDTDLCMRIEDKDDTARGVVIESGIHRVGTILDFTHSSKVDRVIGELILEDRN